ncbi:unnamed protein product [Paramecium octaurelia]|uniref:Uncharacterized protein n=1 Tax=Paramecium octaurelia TaxID=43137 RepID=A0A8S1WDP9_PAROT|nr:unnamed protein product [Paramecium octaurelia]
MGGISIKYKIQKVSEFYISSAQNILSIQINQQSSLLLLQIQNQNIKKLSLFQFKAKQIKHILDIGLKFEVKCTYFKIAKGLFIFSLNEQNEGIFIKSSDQLNISKYLMKLRTPCNSDSNSTIYSCLTINYNEDIIISGGIDQIIIWEQKNIWKLKQLLKVQGNVHSINLNPSETTLISVVQPSYRYFIYLHELSIEQIWTQKQCIEVGYDIRENICFIQDDVFVANTIGKKIVDVLFEYQNDVLEFYKKNKDGIFQIQKQKYQGKDWIQTCKLYDNQYSSRRKLLFCKLKSMLGGFSHQCIKFIRIQDQAKFILIQTIKFEEKFKSLEFTSDLQYVLLSLGNQIKIFEVNQNQ